MCVPLGSSGGGGAVPPELLIKRRERDDKGPDGADARVWVNHFVVTAVQQVLAPQKNRIQEQFSKDKEKWSDATWPTAQTSIKKIPKDRKYKYIFFLSSFLLYFTVTNNFSVLTVLKIWEHDVSGSFLFLKSEICTKSKSREHKSAQFPPWQWKIYNHPRSFMRHIILVQRWRLKLWARHLKILMRPSSHIEFLHQKAPRHQNWMNCCVNIFHPAPDRIASQYVRLQTHSHMALARILYNGMRSEN